MEINYKFIREHGLLVQKYAGTFSLEEYLACFLVVVNNPDFKLITKSLIDIRGLDSNYDHTLADQLVKIRATHGTNISNISTVYLTDSPKAIVVTYLYIDKIKQSNYNYCSTLQTALELLGLSEKLKEVEAVLADLKGKCKGI